MRRGEKGRGEGRNRGAGRGKGRSRWAGRGKGCGVIQGGRSRWTLLASHNFRSARTSRSPHPLFCLTLFHSVFTVARAQFAREEGVREEIRKAGDEKGVIFAK